jgi:hypothetical protein
LCRAGDFVVDVEVAGVATTAVGMLGVTAITADDDVEDLVCGRIR